MRLIVFDCDGTLVDSQHMIVAAMGQAFRACQRIPPPREAVLHVVGLSLTEAITRLVKEGDAGDVATLADEFRAAFVELRGDPDHSEPLFAGAADAIKALGYEDDVLLGIATGKSRRGVQIFLDRFDLTPHFATVQTADDAPSKPHPAMLKQAMSETGATPDETVMIGDTTYDMMMAAEAGVAGLGVAWGYHPSSALRDAGASAVAKDFPELLSVIGGLSVSRDVAE